MTRIFFFQPNKYRNVRETYNGATYHSRREAAYARELDLRLRVRGPERIKSWRRQVRLPLEVNGCHICDCVVDFELTHLDGSIELVEVKGMETDVYKLKRKLLDATYLKAHPEVTYTVVK